MITIGPPVTSFVSAPSHELPHVLLVIDQFAKTLGGGERVALQLARLLPESGFRASLLTFSVHPESPALESAACPIRVLPLRRAWGVNAFRAAMELSQFVKRERVQIVQTFFESSDIFAGFATKVFSEAKLVWSRRDMGILRGRKHDLAYRLLGNFPDAVLCVSEQVREHCIRVDRVEPSKVHTVYNGIDTARWDLSKHRGRSGHLVISVGNIRRVKGHDTLIRASALVLKSFPEAKFMILGDVLEPDYFGELKALLLQLGLADQFCFVSGVQDVRTYLAQSAIFVLPSRSEGFSNALVEAMAASLPVVATEVGGNGEAVTDGENGYLVVPDQPDVLAQRILRLLYNPGTAKAMGDAGKRIVAERFSIESMMSRTCGIYRDLLKREPACASSQR